MGNVHLVTGYAGQQHVTAADQGSLNAVLFGSGEYVLDRGNKFSAAIITNNKITVSDGDLIMQGRHIRLNEGSTVDLTIDNGEQGKIRHDLIVVRYSKDAGTTIESADLFVIKGTSAASDPADPSYTQGDLISDHDLLNDMPLYRVVIDGLTIQPLVQLFTEKAFPTISAIETAQATADAAMPKAGGTFTGNTVAYSTPRTTLGLVNEECRASTVDGTAQNVVKYINVT